MQGAFQPGAFQATGFQVEAAATTQPSGGYGFGAYDRTLRRRKREREEREEREELAREIKALEEHLVPEATRERVRAKARIYLPPRVKRAVQQAVKLETVEAFREAEIALRAFDEEEEFAVLISLALH